MQNSGVRSIVISLVYDPSIIIAVQFIVKWLWKVRKSNVKANSLIQVNAKVIRKHYNSRKSAFKTRRKTTNQFT